MADLIITERSNIVAIADAVRSNTGETREITLGDIVNGINQLGSSANLDTSDATATSSDILSGKTAYVDGEKVTGIIQSVEAQTVTPATYNKTAVAKGVYTAGAITVAGDRNLKAENIAEGVTIFGVTGNHTGGVDTSDATATAGDILQGETAYVDGKKVTGTIETKTSSDLTANGATVTVPSGYYASNATKSVSTATQATPSITINASGLITATATQTVGYVAAGSKSATKQLAFQPAKTITPTTTNQTAVSSGYYTGGNITVKGDSNLVADNIKSGVSIFGVAGTYEGSGGSSGSGDTSMEDGLVTRTGSIYTNDRVKSIGSLAFDSNPSLTSVSFSACTTIGDYAFTRCYSLTSVSFPACTTIGSYAFAYCSSLTSVNFPACTTIGSNAFAYCSSLTSVNFPACTTIGSNAFNCCYSLTSVNFPACTTIGSYAFTRCYSLTSVSFPACTTISTGAFNRCSSLNTIYLTASSLCTLSNSNAFSSTAIWSNKGSIYVPSSLVASYKAATNWVFFSNRIFSAP